MQTRTVHQYQTFGPGLDNLLREIESVLQIYAEIAIIFAVLILGVILCLAICEMREPGESKAVSQGRFSPLRVCRAGDRRHSILTAPGRRESYTEWRKR